MPYRYAGPLLLALSGALWAISPAWPHGGGIDRFGCHHDRKAGTYHCHQGPLAGQTYPTQQDMLLTLQSRQAETAPTNEASVLDSQPRPSFTGKVVGVTDGDTIKVFHNGKAEKIRLYGIDCPEKGQAFGNRAKQFTSQLVFGKEVTVKDYGLDNNRFERTLGEIVLPDGRVVNEELLRAGLAWWYRKYVPNRVDLAALEEEARTAKRGLWADPNPVPPWCFRKRMKGQVC